MLSPTTVQAALVALLKADPLLVAALSSADAIKEAQWRGTKFAYPAVRVDISDMRPQGNGACAKRWLATAGSILVYSKGDSSAECENILGLVENAIVGRHLSAAGLTSLEFRVDQVVYPFRETNLWRGEILFATTAIET
jgi:hypothetical protein